MVSQNHVYLEKEREIPSSDVAIVKLTVRRRLNSSDTAEAQSRSKPQSQGLYVSERTPATKAELGRPHHKHSAANGGVVNLESAKTLLIVSEFNQAAHGRSILSVSNSKSARIDSSRTARAQKLSSRQQNKLTVTYLARSDGTGNRHSSTESQLRVANAAQPRSISQHWT